MFYLFKTIKEMSSVHDLKGSLRKCEVSSAWAEWSPGERCVASKLEEEKQYPCV